MNSIPSLRAGTGASRSGACFQAGANSGPSRFVQRPSRARFQASPSDQEGSSAASPSTMELLRRDLDFLEAQTGLDLHSSFDSVAEVHDTLVAALNPLAGKAMAEELEQQVAGMQNELAIAHQAVHASEARLEQTLQNLVKLEEEVLGVLESTMPTAAATNDVAVAGVAADGDRNSELSFHSALNSSASSSMNASALAEQPKPKHTASKRRRQDNGLDMTLDLGQELRRFWYPVHFSSHLKTDILVPLELFGEPWVLFRSEDGAPACVRDECAHRACPLSLGSVVEGQVQCAYHGWRFDASGECTTMPSTLYCAGVSVTALPVAEADGLIWIYPGGFDLDGGVAVKGDKRSSDTVSGQDSIAPSLAPPGASVEALRPPKGFQVHAELVMEVPVDHGLLLENLLDLAHAPFTHVTTFAKGWPVPDVVRFQASQLLSGSWQPYPIDMAFGPPCMVLSTIGLQQPGRIEHGARAADCRNHLHQMHVCLPARRGHTRLLYRMSLDFMGWSRFVPGIQRFWEYIAKQVLGEDLVLVRGQQERFERHGADIWANPRSYDKLGVRYRRWRNSLIRGDAEAMRAVEGTPTTLSAAEVLFASMEEDLDVHAGGA